MSEPHRTGRLSTLAAALVVARRDFVAILFSRSFIFFLLGPLFPILVGGLAGGIGQRVQQTADRPELGLAMQANDVAAMVRAHQRIAPQIGAVMPVLVVVKQLAPGESFDPAGAMRGNGANLAAIVSGTPAAPVLTGPSERIEQWRGRVSMLAAEAQATAPPAYPEVKLAGIATSKASLISSGF